MALRCSNDRYRNIIPTAVSPGGWVFSSILLLDLSQAPSGGGHLKAVYTKMFTHSSNPANLAAWGNTTQEKRRGTGVGRATQLKFVSSWVAEPAVTNSDGLIGMVNVTTTEWVSCMKFQEAEDVADSRKALKD